MTKEQEKAVEELENLAEYGLCYTITSDIQENINIALKLIQKQQEENTSLKVELEKKNKIIDDAINFIQDNCLEEIADMKGCYRETANIGNLQELMDILKGK